MRRALVIALLVTAALPARAAAIPATSEPSLVRLGGVHDARAYARGRAGTVAFAVAVPAARSAA